MTLPLRAPDLNKALELFRSLCNRGPAEVPAMRQGEPVVLYGAGNLGRLAVEFLQHVHIPVSRVLDRAVGKGLSLCLGVPVHTPERVREGEDCPILVTTLSASFTEIQQQLKGLGWRRVWPFYDYAQHFVRQHPLNNGWFSGPLSAEDRAEMEAVLATLADAQSRAAYLQFVAWRTVREDWIFEDAPVSLDNRYFIKPVLDMLTETEDFMDVGAYDGRVLTKLLEHSHGGLSSALLIEPDDQNVAKLRETLSRMPPEIRARTEVLPVAVSNHSGRVPFSHGFDLASRLCDIRPSTVDSVRLDDMNRRVSFLKVHVEGGEYDALLGGLETIRKCRPMVAATVYHNRDGLWRTPRWLMESLPNYRFHFGVHSWCGTGAVLYALPQHRIFRHR